MADDNKAPETDNPHPRDPRFGQTGVDKPHGGGSLDSEMEDAARQPRRDGDLPKPNPNNPDSPANPVSTAQRDLDRQRPQVSQKPADQR